MEARSKSSNAVTEAASRCAICASRLPADAARARLSTHRPGGLRPLTTQRAASFTTTRCRRSFTLPSGPDAVGEGLFDERMAAAGHLSRRGDRRRSREGREFGTCVTDTLPEPLFCEKAPGGARSRIWDWSDHGENRARPTPPASVSTATGSASPRCFRAAFGRRVASLPEPIQQAPSKGTCQHHGGTVGHGQEGITVVPRFRSGHGLDPNAPEWPTWDVYTEASSPLMIFGDPVQSQTSTEQDEICALWGPVYAREVP